MQLSSGAPYFLFGRVHAVEKQLGIKIPTIDVIEQWAAIIQQHGVDETILVADSYYLTEDARAVLNGLQVKYVCAITKERFPSLVEEVQTRVEKPGQWAGAWNDETGELLTYYWSTDKDVGKKFVITNSLFETKGKTPKHTIPAYDMYNVMYSLCDGFNRNLHDRTWPHRCSGGTNGGTAGVVHNFYFSAILQNTYNAYFDIHSKLTEKASFKDFSLELADEIYAYALTL